MLRRILTCAAAVSLAAAYGTPARADEGLWTFDAFPAAKVEAAYGVDIDRRWLDHVMGAAVRLSNGCSASLVSSQGLVLTANHCVSECAQAVSGPGQNDYTDGFVAAGTGKEKPCAGLSAEVLTSITDVTSDVLRALAGRSGAALVEARTEATARLEKDGCSGDPARRCQLVELYHGGRYDLYAYRYYDRVELAFSPGVSASAFGGDEFPPENFDAAFLRLYDAGAPASTPDHLAWNASAPRAGEPVFLAGNPRRSERELTVSELQTQRDFALPYTLVESAELIGRLIRFGEESPDNARADQFELFDVQNYYGYSLELLSALNEESFFAKKAAEEADLRSKVGPSVQPAWDAIARAEQARRELGLAYDDLDGGPTLSGGPASVLFVDARTLVRGAIERAKPSAQRLPDYTDGRLPALEKDLFEDQPIDVPLEQLQLESWLARTRDYLPSDDPTARLLLGGETPETQSALLSQSKLGDVALRRQLWDGGLAAIRASNDPMIRYALRIEPAARALRATWEATVTEPETRATGIIARARLGISGTDPYPDASGSLRLSYGKIDGFTNGGKTAPAFSTFGDLYRRATGHDPYKLGARWLAAEKTLNPSTVLDMSTTNDAINGNSGSPVLNARADVIGVFGGGNSFASGGDYGYDPERNRAYAATTAAISEALVKVYGAGNLAKELSGSPP